MLNPNVKLRCLDKTYTLTSDEDVTKIKQEILNFANDLENKKRDDDIAYSKQIDESILQKAKDASLPWGRVF